MEVQLKKSFLIQELIETSVCNYIKAIQAGQISVGFCSCVAILANNYLSLNEAL
jgi:hypothetical protein